jgi:putative transposase
MDEAHLYTAFAYVSLNPVRARLVQRAQDWKWSSVHAHMCGVDDGLTTPGPLRARVGDVASFLDQDHGDEEFTSLRKSEIIGRPIGGDSFMESLEASLGQTLRRKKRGPRKKDE